jgi:hypothetical protein
MASIVPHRTRSGEQYLPRGSRVTSLGEGIYIIDNTGTGGVPLLGLGLPMFCLHRRQRKTHTEDSSLHPIPSNHTPDTPPEYDAPLCSTCSSLNLHAILHDGVPKEHAIPLGHLTEILDKSNHCGLCNLVAIVVRRAWSLDKLPASVTCALYALECGYPDIPDYVSPVLRDSVIGCISGPLIDLGML